MAARTTTEDILTSSFVSSPNAGRPVRIGLYGTETFWPATFERSVQFTNPLQAGEPLSLTFSASPAIERGFRLLPG